MRFFLGMICLAASLCAEGPFVFRDAGPGSLELTEGGKPVYVYNHGMNLKPGAPEERRRSGYLHPVYTPGGTIVTDDFPKDHYHHRGIFWTWPEVVTGGQKYDLWLVEGIHQKFVRWLKREGSASSAALAVENGWYVGDRKLVRETVTIVARPAASARRALDFDLTFEALSEPVSISGQQDGKGYGGFCIRFAPREGTLVRTDAGREEKDTNLVPHPWAELEGTFAGRRAGARIEIDRSNPGYPNGWCLRNYGFLGVNFPGLERRILKRGEPLRLKYRVTAFDAPGR